MLLVVRIRVGDQELDVAVRYWEGAVGIEGTVEGRPVTGSGYIEMTGYDQEETGARGVTRAAR